MVYLFLADGFEEVEALATLDVLRRAKIQVKTVGIDKNIITGAHNIPVTTDMATADVSLDENLEAVILPGGMPGTINLENNNVVQNSIDYAYKNNKYICAICAAPSILGHKGLLKDKEAICFPGFEKELDCKKISNDFVCVDGKFITAKGMGSAVEFGLRIVGEFKGKNVENELRSSLQIYNG